MLDAHLDHIRAAPSAIGSVELIVRRPERGARELLELAELDPLRGLVGDSWLARGNKHTADGAADPQNQITLINVRAIAAVAERERWPLAGDQLYVDFDLSHALLPAGARVEVGEALLEISATPHTGCAKFTERFGSEATRWVNTPIGRELRLRGVHARILRGGIVRTGDAIRRG